MAITSLLDIDLQSLIKDIEKACGIILSRVECGEQLLLKTLAIISRDEDASKITAIEILRLGDFLNELNLYL